MSESPQSSYQQQRTYQQRSSSSSSTSTSDNGSRGRSSRPRDRLRHQSRQQSQRARTQDTTGSNFEQSKLTSWSSPRAGAGVDQFQPPPGAVLVDSRHVSADLPNGTYSSVSRSYAGSIAPGTDYRATVNRTVSSSSSSSSPNTLAREFFNWPTSGKNSTLSRTYQKKKIVTSSSSSMTDAAGTYIHRLHM